MTEITWRLGSSSTNAALTMPELEPWELHFVQLRSFYRLEDDWDGLGGSAPLAGVVDTAFALLTAFQKHPDVEAPSRVIASPSGSVIFEWQTPDGHRLEAEISEPGLVEYCLKQLGTDPVFWEEPLPDRRKKPSWGRSSTAVTSEAA